MTQVLIVKAKRDGYRRCGRGFSSTTPTEIPVSDLTEEEVERLKTDAGLVVVEGVAGDAAATTAQAGTALAEAKARANGLQEELQKFVAANAKLVDRVAELEGDVKTLETKLATLSSEKETVGQEANRLTGELVEVKKENDSLKKQLKNASEKTK